jgi:hypothetical protein
MGMLLAPHPKEISTYTILSLLTSKDRGEGEVPSSFAGLDTL